MPSYAQTTSQFHVHAMSGSCHVHACPCPSRYAMHAHAMSMHAHAMSMYAGSCHAHVTHAMSMQCPCHVHSMSMSMSMSCRTCPCQVISMLHVLLCRVHEMLHMFIFMRTIQLPQIYSRIDLRIGKQFPMWNGPARYIQDKRAGTYFGFVERIAPPGAIRST